MSKGFGRNSKPKSSWTRRVLDLARAELYTKLVKSEMDSSNYNVPGIVVACFGDHGKTIGTLDYPMCEPINAHKERKDVKVVNFDALLQLDDGLHSVSASAPSALWQLNLTKRGITAVVSLFMSVLSVSMVNTSLHTDCRSIARVKASTAATISSDVAMAVCVVSLMANRTSLVYTLQYSPTLFSVCRLVIIHGMAPPHLSALGLDTRGAHRLHFTWSGLILSVVHFVRVLLHVVRDFP